MAICNAYISYQIFLSMAQISQCDIGPCSKKIIPPISSSIVGIYFPLVFPCMSLNTKDTKWYYVRPIHHPLYNYIKISTTSRIHPSVYIGICIPTIGYNQDHILALAVLIAPLKYFTKTHLSTSISIWGHSICRPNNKICSLFQDKLTRFSKKLIDFNNLLTNWSCFVHPHLKFDYLSFYSIH